MFRRATMPECCATCEYRAVNTSYYADGTPTREKVYCSKDRDFEMPRFADEVLCVCDGYERSWGVEQEYRRRCGLPELSSELYPYSVQRRDEGNQEKLRLAFLAQGNNRSLTLDRQMEIWDGVTDVSVFDSDS